MATRWPFWKWRRWKSIGFCLWPPSTCIWSLKLKFQSKLDLHSGNHSTYRVQASAYGHHQHAYEIWNWNSKANLTYAPETMSSTDRRTDGRTDGRTRWIQYTPHPTSLGGGIIKTIKLKIHIFTFEMPENTLKCGYWFISHYWYWFWWWWCWFCCAFCMTPRHR